MTAGAVGVHLAGRLSVSAGESVVDAQAFRGRQGRVVFAYLVAHHHKAVPRDELAEVLWGDDLPAQWDANLSAVVSRLRALLGRIGLDGAAVIPGAFGSYEFRPSGELWVDLEYAESSLDGAESAALEGDHARAVAAASVSREIARRPLLPGDEGVWLERKRQELRGLRVRAGERLAASREQLGQLDVAVRDLEEVIELEPFREPAYRHLMQLHAASGNRAEALRTWERCRELLSSELGTDPSPETEKVYLDILQAAPERDRPAAPAGTIAILFTDIVGSTELYGSLGDEAAEAVRRTHFGLLRDAVATRGGQEVKSLGDGLMVAFPSVVDALGCAVAIQQAVESHNRTSESPLGVRVGMHVGEPILHEDDYFGLSVVIARRLCDSADGGQIVVSSLVRGLNGSRGGYDFRDLGPRTLKGVPDPVDAVDVAWEPAAPDRIPLPPIVDLGERLRFVGRDFELATLRRHLDTKHAHFVAIPGEPGIGKTRLVGEFARMAFDAGSTVLFGRCEEEEIVPFQPFVEALGHYVASCSSDELRRSAGAGASDLARFIPEVTRRLPDLPPPMTGDAESERYRLFEAVASTLRGIAAASSLVLVLEDLHWADRPTVLMLRHILRRRDPARLLVLGTFRDTEVGRDHPLSEAIADLERDDLVDRLEVPPLDAAEVGQLLEAMGGASAMTRRVYEATDGNPLFVREVVRHLDESGGIDVPPSVKEVTARRVSRLADPAPRILSVASVVGREFDLDLVVELTELGENDVVDALELAVGARIVDEVPKALDRYGFSHALVREALYDELTASRRARLHRQIAEALERLRPDHLSELAYHFAEAGPGSAGKALAYAVRAAEAAMKQLAYEEAAAQYERALSAASDPKHRIELLLALGDASRKSGDGANAAAAYGSASDLALEAGDDAGFARAALGLAEGWLFTGLVDAERVATLRRALDALGDTEDLLRARLLAKLADAVYHERDSSALRDDLSARALALARAAGDPATLAECLDVRNFAMWGIQPTSDQLEIAAEIVELGRRMSDKEVELRGVTWAMHAWQEIGDIERLSELLGTYEALADELRQPRYVWYAMTRRASLLIALGHYDEGGRLAREALELGRQAGEPDAHHVYSGSMTVVWQDRADDGGLAVVQAERDDHETRFAGDEHNSTMLWWRWQALASDADRGVTVEAQQHLDRMRSQAFAADRNFHWLTNMCSIARVCASLRDREAAFDLHELLLPWSGRLCYPGGVVMNGAVDHHLGRLASLLGRPEAAEHLRRAIEYYDRSGLRPASAHARYDLAKLLGSGELAAEAAAIASDVGMPVLEGRTQQLLSTQERRDLGEA